MLLDREQCIRFINRTAPGLDPEGVRGTSVYAFVPESQHDQMRECFERVLESGEPDHYENVYTTEEGHISLWESRVGAVKEGDEVTGFVVFASDVTERRSATFDRERFFEMSLDLMCIAGFDGYFKVISSAFTRTLGFSEEELLAEPFITFVHPDDRDATASAMKRLDSGDSVTGFENRYLSKDGSYRAFQWNAAVDKDTRRILATARDVTDQRILQAKLLQSQKMDAIGQLAGGVAHDFNNLMLAVLANTSMAREEVLANSELDETLGEIEAAARRAADLTKQLLALSRRQPVSKKVIDLNAAAKSMKRMLRRLIPESIEIDVIEGHSLSMVEGDPSQIEQMILNLCVNARDAMPDGGRLTLETENVRIDGRYREAHPWAKAGRYVLLTVSDTGEGMSADVKERIFEPFFTTKQQGSGTGLGLATVYGVVEQHGGMIHVYSELGEGTAFKVYLPVVERLASEVGQRVVADAPGGRETILLAEDEELVRRVVSKILRRGGYEVRAAADGVEALEYFARSPENIDLVLLDVVMPNLGGPDVYRKMAEVRPGLPSSSRVATAMPPASRRCCPRAATSSTSPTSKRTCCAVYARHSIRAEACGRTAGSGPVYSRHVDADPALPDPRARPLSPRRLRRQGRRLR